MRRTTERPLANWGAVGRARRAAIGPFGHVASDASGAALRASKALPHYKLARDLRRVRRSDQCGVLTRGVAPNRGVYVQP